jgi:serine/threonine protein phosphatase PrpC
MNQPTLAFDMGATTHPGRVRPRNEDSHLLRADAGIWAVADGMGGHEAGDVASQLIVKELDTISATESAIGLLEETKKRLFLANRQIMEISHQRGGAIIGSTVAILLISEDHYACVWAGDSRVYLAQHDTIRQITRDHTEVEEMLASGLVNVDEARNWPNNVITRAVGVQDNPELEIVTGVFEHSDIFVLCSDGLTKHVSDDEILRYVSNCDAQASSAALVQLALDRGGLDNVTVIVVRPQRLRSPKERTVQATLLTVPPATDVWD